MSVILFCCVFMLLCWFEFIESDWIDSMDSLTFFDDVDLFRREDDLALKGIDCFLIEPFP